MAKSSLEEGHVILVGAGPGDVGLLTLRGKDWLARADVVIYDQKEDPNYEKAEKIYKEVERMSDIAKKISAISSYKVKKYVGKTRIIDIDKAASSPERNRRPTT